MKAQTSKRIAIIAGGLALGFGAGLIAFYGQSATVPQEPAEQPAPPVIVSSPGSRVAYARRLEQIFLSNGLDMSVTAEETNIINSKYREFLYKKWPRLSFFGYINRPFIYRLLSDANVLPTARSKGFAAVEFDSKGPSGTSIFDLTGPELPTCDLNGHICLK